MSDGCIVSGEFISDWNTCIALESAFVADHHLKNRNNFKIIFVFIYIVHVLYTFETHNSTYTESHSHTHRVSFPYTLSLIPIPDELVSVDLV